jgi:single-strand DNA-binding protein
MISRNQSIIHRSNEMSYQKLIIIGNLGRDPEMRYTVDGKPVTSFSVATSRKYNDNEETTWFRVSVWGNQAESCNQYLHKGSKVLVEGRLDPDKATGAPKVFQKKDGSWGASYEVFADTVRFLSSRGESEQLTDEEVPF